MSWTNLVSCRNLVLWISLVSWISLMSWKNLVSCRNLVLWISPVSWTKLDMSIEVCIEPDFVDIESSVSCVQALGELWTPSVPSY